MSSTRLSRRAALAVGLSIVAIMVVWAPMLALANGTDNAAAQGANSASAPGQTGTAGNSGSAPGHAVTETIETTTAPGSSGSAPGQTKTDTSTTTTPPAPSNGGGSSNAGGANPNAGGGNPNSGKPTTTTSGGGSPESHGDKDATGGSPSGKGDGPTTGTDGNNCDGGSGGNGKGANTSGDFDNTCDTSSGGPAPNGNGGGKAKGKPCAGCVGNADDKNPPGQSKNDKNNGYECDGNKGVGKGNPAHTGCKPIIVIDTDPVCTAWTLNASATNGSVTAPAELTDGSHVYTTSAAKSVTFTAATGYSADGTATGATSISKTSGAYSAYPGCSASVSASFSKIGGKIVDCDNDGIADGVDEDLSDCDSSSPPPPDCDGDGIDDNVDPDISSCDPLPPGEDCDGDGVPDDADTDLSACDPDQLPETCPDGTPMPESGQCVKGIIITRPPDVDEDEDPSDPLFPDVAGKKLAAPEAVSPSVLPFTGGNLLPFLMLSLGLVATGAAATAKRRKA